MFQLASYDFDSNIHFYEYNDLKIVLDVNSGAVHLLDEPAFKIMQNLVAFEGDFYRAAEALTSEYPPDELYDTVFELLALWEDGAIFTEKEEDLSPLLSTLTIKALCLNVAHLCNMKCSYCFAGQGEFNMPKGLMSIEVGQRAIDFLIAKSEGRRQLEVDFFGGEPLLNIGVVKQIVKYAQKRGQETGQQFNFTLTTNAVLLTDEIMDFIIAHDISLILSLDGRPEVNDRHRLMVNGRGSYDIILPNIKNAIARSPVSHYVRGTFTRDNRSFSRDVQHMADAGFKSLSMEPAVGEGDEFSIRREDLPWVLAEYEKLTELLLNYSRAGREVEFFHFNLNLQRGPCLAKRISGCGAGTEYLVITPEGDIYPCHRFVGEEKFYMGNLADDKIAAKIQELFKANHLENKPECVKCWARYFCGGGCHANNYYRNHDITKPDEISCAMQKKRIESAIYIDIHKSLL